MCRPGTRHVDDRIDRGSYAEFRRLKRLKLAEDPEFLIWARSPSPMAEPLLAPPEAAAAAGTAATAPRREGKAAAEVLPEQKALDDEETALFLCVPFPKTIRGVCAYSTRRHCPGVMSAVDQAAIAIQPQQFSRSNSATAIPPGTGTGQHARPACVHDVTSALRRLGQL